MRGLVVSFHHPPDPSIGAQRTGALARYLRERSHEVRVISAAGSFPDSEPDVLRPNWIDFRTCRMVRSMEPSGDDRKPSKASWVGSPDLMRSVDSQRGPRARGVAKRLAGPGSAPRRWASAVRATALEWPDAMAPWIPGALKEGNKLLNVWLPDFILASGPPFSAFVVAHRLSERHGVPWVADYRDLWTESTYYRAAPLHRRLDRRSEGSLLRSASFATTVSRPLAEDLRRAFRVRAEVVMNGYDRFEVDPVDLRRPLSDARLNLAYVGGNMYSGRRTPAPLLRAAKSLAWGSTDVRFHFIGSDPELIRNIASAEGAEELVEVHPQVSRSECLALQARADALMLLMWNDPGEAGVYSGKLFEYIAVSRPIVLVGYPYGVAAELIRDRGLGHVAFDLASARTALTALAKLKPADDALIPDLDPAKRVGLDRGAQFSHLLRHLGSLRAPTKTADRRSAR